MSIDTHQKVSADHLRRDAFLYVRQSSLRVLRKNSIQGFRLDLAIRCCGMIVV
jgi:hypothetical protein